MKHLTCNRWPGMTLCEEGTATEEGEPCEDCATVVRCPGCGGFIGLIGEPARCPYGQRKAEVTPIPKAPRAKKRRQSMPPHIRINVMVRANGWCEINGEGCTRFATEVHHRRRRSQGGAHTPQNLLALCLLCHSRTHANPARSNELGHLLKPGHPEWDACGNETTP